MEKTETEKFETETDTFGYVCFVSVVFPFHMINTGLCNVPW